MRVAEERLEFRLDLCLGVMEVAQTEASEKTLPLTRPIAQPQTQSFGSCVTKCHRDFWLLQKHLNVPQPAPQGGVRGRPSQTRQRRREIVRPTVGVVNSGGRTTKGETERASTSAKRRIKWKAAKGALCWVSCFHTAGDGGQEVLRICPQKKSWIFFLKVSLQLYYRSNSISMFTLKLDSRHKNSVTDNQLFIAQRLLPPPRGGWRSQPRCFLFDPSIALSSNSAS